MKTEPASKRAQEQAKSKAFLTNKDNLPQEVTTLLEVSREQEEPIDYSAVKALISALYGL